MKEQKNNNITAVQQLAETFGSLDELIKQFDDMLYRLTWAYTGSSQEQGFLAQDYEFTEKLKEAIKTDMLSLRNSGLPEPQYTPIPPLVPLTEEQMTFRVQTNIPVVRSIARATLIAKARGLTGFTPVKMEGIVYLLLNGWTEKEATAYQKAGGYLWGSFTEKGFLATNIHLM